MSWGEGDDPVEPTTGTSGDITITTVPLDIRLVADGEALDGYTADLGDPVDEKYVLDYDKTMLAAMASGLPRIKVGAISTGSSIKSADVTGPDAAIKGLTVAFDGANGALTIKGTANEAGDVELALYMGMSDAWTKLVITHSGATASNTIPATPISDDNSGIPEAYIIATFVLSVKNTSAPGVIDDVIGKTTNEAVSADIVKAIRDDNNNNFLLVVDSNDNVLSLNGKSSDLKPLSDDSDVVSMKMAFLTLDANGALVVSNDAGADRTASFDIRSGNSASARGIAVTDGVADFTVKAGQTAENDLYTINVKAGTPAANSSVSIKAAPAAGTVLATQKIEVKRSGTAPGSTSSGGACDMGFGLVSIAGLAALGAKTLRKRSR